MKIIVNADDFGCSTDKTDAIVEFFNLGLLNTTTIMVNMPDFERASEIAEKNSFFDAVGLHLNLTEGVPLTDGLKQLDWFCTNGEFNGRFHITRSKRFYLTRKEKLGVQKEVEAQMEKYRSKGFPLLHLDSHHHSHTDPSVAALVLPLAKKFGFRSVRISRNIPRPGFGPIKKLYKHYINSLIDRTGFLHTDYFGNALETLRAISLMPKDATIEIMTHPLKHYDSGVERLYDSDTPVSNVKIMIDQIREMAAENH